MWHMICSIWADTNKISRSMFPSLIINDRKVLIKENFGNKKLFPLSSWESQYWIPLLSVTISYVIRKRYKCLSDTKLIREPLGAVLPVSSGSPWYSVIRQPLNNNWINNSVKLSWKAKFESIKTSFQTKPNVYNKTWEVYNLIKLPDSKIFEIFEPLGCINNNL